MFLHSLCRKNRHENHADLSDSRLGSRRRCFSSYSLQVIKPKTVSEHEINLLFSLKSEKKPFAFLWHFNVEYIILLLSFTSSSKETILSLFSCASKESKVSFKNCRLILANNVYVYCLQSQLRISYFIIFSRYLFFLQVLEVTRYFCH